MPNADHYAIVMGISTYPQIGSINYAMRDAARFLEWLAAADGGDIPLGNNIQVVPATDPRSFNPADPTSLFQIKPIFEDVRRAFFQMGLRDAGFSGKRLYVYFAGHGIAPDFSDIGLLMANAARDLENECLGVLKTRQFFDNHPIFEEVIYILDCCRDRGLQEAAFELKPPPLNVNYNNAHLASRHAVVMATTDRNQAFEDSNLAHGEGGGVLTTALLEHLSGKGYYPGGNITTTTLDNYLEDRVPQLAHTFGREQQAEVATYPPNQDIIFTRIPEAQIPTVELHIYPETPIAGQIFLRNGDTMSEIDRVDASTCARQTPWILDLKKNTRYALNSNANPTPEVIEPLEFSDAGPYEFVYHTQ